MKKSSISRILISTLCLGSSLLLSLSLLTLGWFAGPFAKTEDDQTIDGGIDLRGYFYAGDGLSSLTAYEIVTPVHFNNLVRLQNLGIFSSKKAYFRLGHDFGGAIGEKVINGYNSQTNQPNYSTVLEMGQYSTNTVILPIGSEGTPFTGEFDGKDIVINNLKVRGYPEDIGVFGYVSYEGTVKNLVCENLTIESTGYSSDAEDDSHILFERDVDNLFAQNARYFATARLSLIDGNGTETNLKKLNGVSGTSLSDLSKTDNYTVTTVENETRYVSSYYLKATYPSGSNKGNFTYSWKSSSPIVKKKGDSDNEMIIDLASLKDSEEFNSGESKQSDARVSLIASIDIDGYVFSRVIQSYTLEFYSNGHGFYGWIVMDNKNVKKGDGAPTLSIGQEGEYYINKSINGSGQVNTGQSDIALYYRNSSGWIAVTSGVNVYQGIGAPTWEAFDTYSAGDIYIDKNTYLVYTKESQKKYYSAKAFCEYINPANDVGNTHHYHHGNNIGFLAGHVDGTIENSYIYNGTFVFNNAGQQYTAINTESETGLIGEIGTNVVSNIQPSFGLKKNGDIGVINLSKVYSLIRDKDENDNDRPMRIGDEVKAGQANGKNYISYSNYLTEASYSRFSQYLRKSASGIQEFITSTGRDMSGGSPSDWHDFTIASMRDDYNSVDFLWNQVIEDERRGFYVDTTNDDLYVKEDYEWSDPLTSGVFKGALAPSNSVGNDGDYRFNPVTNVLFKKQSSSWARVAALVGTGVPNTNFGKVDELYVDTDDGNIYKRSAGSWSQIATSQSDSIAPDPNTGTNGNYYIDTVSYTIFKNNTGIWEILDYCYSGAGVPDKSANNSGDRGMGVFKIISSYNSNAKIGAETDHYKYFTQNLGECKIMKGTPKTKVYYSTAELDNKKGGDSWSTSPLRGTSLPESYDIGSFNWQFGRDYNYCFELDLAQMSQSQGYYMSNTDSNFLTNYLYSILIDKNGAPIEPGSNEFGFMFISSENESMSSLSSYMPIGKPGGKHNFGSDSSPRYYPSDCIAFSIDNSNGANVSVVGNKADITIYSNDVSSSDAVEALYTMKSSPAGNIDEHRFFSYDVKTGDTSTETIKYGDLYIDITNVKLYQENTDGDGWTLKVSTDGEGAPTSASTDGAYYIDTDGNYLYRYSSASSKWEKVYGTLIGNGAPSIENQDMKDDNALYAHIFKLPPGDYVLGSNDDNNAANVYFLAVQGQTEATLGVNDMAGIGNAVNDVDFLTAPKSDGNGLKYAKFSFTSNFNTLNGQFFIGVLDNDNTKKFRIQFSDAPNRYVTYLLTYSRTTELTYYIVVLDGNGQVVSSNSYTEASLIYRSS